MRIVKSDLLSYVEVLYICPECSSKQVFNYSALLDILPKTLVSAMSFDKCSECDAYFRPNDAAFISIGGL